MSDNKALIDRATVAVIELRRYGLAHPGAPGWHSGLCESAADVLVELGVLAGNQADENARLQEQLAAMTVELAASQRDFRAARARAEQMEAERDAAVEFIKWIDEEFGNYMPVLYHHRFEAWRGAQGGGQSAKCF